ncbi:MAG: hypothetical protein IJO09_07085 [Oscillospiraceae bacterium]|nr:hypothetical protein [Oscillospiraceae bacterium]
MKKILYIIMAAIMVLSLCACEEEEAPISGKEFDPDDYALETVERYEHRDYGIIIEYPSAFSEKVGNFELDGYISFEKEDAAVFVYVPDYENNDVLFVEGYAKDILKLQGEAGSGNTKYGKSSGYKSISHSGDRIRVDFVIKGVDAFYRFAYETKAEGFTEEDETFRQVMESIRIDDGVYNKLTSMAARYKTILDYAKSMQYITDADYINHSLNNFESTNEERHKNSALSTCVTIRTKISEICDYERAAGDIYEKEWNKIVGLAKGIVESCDRMEACINEGDIEGAQKIARTEFKDDLSKAAESYLSIINSEISEY